MNDRRRAILAALGGALLVLGVIYAPPWSDDGVTVSASATSGKDWGVDLYAGKARPAVEPVASSDGRRRVRAAAPRLGSRSGGGGGSSGTWPDATTTGIPAGTTLTNYTGSCTIAADNVVIDSKIITCSGMQTYGTGTIIRNSKLNTSIQTNDADATLTIEDSEIDGLNHSAPAIGIENLTVRRSNVYGAQHGVQCYGNCTIEDNYIHDMWTGGQALGWHENAFISNGGGDMVIRHNRLYCTGGCTADLALLPDDDLVNVTVDDNLFIASPDSAYCFYGGGTDGAKPGSNSGIVVTNNVWQYGPNNKCATFGPVTYMDMTGPGNVWTNNKWEDGATMDPVF